MRHLPNLITCANLALGLIGLRLMSEGLVTWVLVCFAGALIADFLDGMVARWLGVSSPMGAELDSLADVVTFGVLPGFAGFDVLYGLVADGGLPAWVCYLSFSYPVCAALRLAKFNVDERKTKDFYGLNTPSAAIAIMGLWSFHRLYGILDLGLSPTLAAVLTVVTLLSIGLLCLSDLPMLSLKPTPRDRRRSMRQIGMLLGGAVIASLYLPLAPFLVILWYVVFSAFHFITTHRS